MKVFNMSRQAGKTTKIIKFVVESEKECFIVCPTEQAASHIRREIKEYIEQSSKFHGGRK